MFGGVFEPYGFAYPDPQWLIMSASHTDFLLLLLGNTVPSSPRPQNTCLKLLYSLAPDVQSCYPSRPHPAPRSFPDLFDTTT